MTSGSRIALQMCPFSAYLESGMADRFQVVRWFELDEPARGSLLATRSTDICAVATAGHIGCPADLVHRLPGLRVIAINGVGLDKVDLALAARRGIKVTTTPGALAEDVADLAVGLVIGLLRGIAPADAFVRSGQWLAGERGLARKVTGRHFGILGLGQIGSAIAARLAPFGPVSYCGPRRKPVPYFYHDTVLALAQASDVLVIACPATPDTIRMVNTAVLAALGEEGYLVNVSRGAIVDEVALIEALDTGRLAGAGLDVFVDEPHVPVALCASPRTLLTPHIASATVETRRRMADLVLAGLDSIAFAQDA
jgi:lactate dehydrogenase-like 2-hydroxyacid dehydrogenase